MAEGGPEVTVVIPTRDRWELLRSSLDSALSQERVEHEVVVVDDGSVDETPERLSELRDPRLRVLRHERSQGVAGARNSGIEAARGEWIAFLDDDDLWAPHKLRTQLDVAEAEGASFVYGAAVFIDEETRVVRGDVVPPPPRLLVRELLEWNVIPSAASNVMARAEQLRRLGGFDAKFIQLDDWDMWIRLAMDARPEATDLVLLACRLHRGNTLVSDERDVWPDFEYLKSKHADTFRRLGAKPDEVRFSHWIAAGHRRNGRRLQAARTYLKCARSARSAGNVLLAGRVMLGEWAMRGGALVRVPPDDPPWLDRYRPDA